MDPTDIRNKPTYSLHFAPCKVLTNTKTTEFIDTILNEEPTNNYASLYIQGRKLVGKEIYYGTLKPYTVPPNSIIEHNQDEIQLIDTSKLTKITTVMNYEREGNEERLIEEHHKFIEFINLTNLIHEK